MVMMMMMMMMMMMVGIIRGTSKMEFGEPCSGRRGNSKTMGGTLWSGESDGFLLRILYMLCSLLCTCAYTNKHMLCSSVTKLLRDRERIDRVGADRAYCYIAGSVA